MSYGPTLPAVRYALRQKIDGLKDEIRAYFSNNMRIFLDSLSFIPPFSKGAFGCLKMSLFYENRLVLLYVELSQGVKPRWLTEDATIEIANIEGLRALIDRWAEKHIVVF